MMVVTNRRVWKYQNLYILEVQQYVERLFLKYEIIFAFGFLQYSRRYFNCAGFKINFKKG